MQINKQINKIFKIYILKTIGIIVFSKLNIIIKKNLR